MGVLSSRGKASPKARKKKTSEIPRTLTLSLSAGASANARTMNTTDVRSRPNHVIRITVTSIPATAIAYSSDFIASGSVARRRPVTRTENIVGP
jgi:hypothetical protein